MLRVLFQIVILLFVAPNHLALAAPVETTISECWENHSHVEMSACVKSRASEARAALDAAEASARTWIEKRNEEPRHIARMLKTLEESEKSFQLYRRDQCNFHAALVAGGNAAHDLRSACEAELDASRTEHLKATVSRWAQ